MAGISEEDLNRLADLLNRGLFPAANDLTSAIENLNKQTEKGIQFESLNLSAKKRIAEEERALLLRQNTIQKSYGDQIKKILNQAKEGDITRAEAQQAINELRATTKAAIQDPSLQIAFEKQAAITERNAKLVDIANSEFVQSISASTKTLASQLLGSAKSLISSYQSGGGQIGLGAATLEAAATTAGTAIQGIGNIAGAAGTALSAFPGRAKFAGMALQFLGGAAGMAGSALSATARTVLPILQHELEKNIAAFQSLSNNGALFSGGLGEMIRVAGQGGLTLDQLNNIVKTNSDTITALGEGMSSGTKRITSALNTGGDSFRKQMLNLGFTVEEQGTIVAETMQNMRQSGGRLMANDATIIEQTKKYAENLRIVSDITGEDGKKKQQLINQQNAQLAVQQKLATMTETQRIAFTNAQKNMSDLQVKALNEMIASGGQIITPELAATIAQMPSLQASLNDMYSQFNQGVLTEESTRKIQAERAAGIKQELLSQEGIGLAGIAKVGGMAQQIVESMGNELAFRNKFTSDAIAAAEAAVKGQKDTADAQTKAATDAILANQNLMTKIQQTVMDTGVMQAYSKAVATATDELEKMISTLRSEMGGTASGKTGEKTGSEKTGEEIGSVVGGVGGALAGAQLGAMVGAIGGPIGIAAGTVIGGILGSLLGEHLGSKAGGAVGSAVDKGATAPQDSFGISGIQAIPFASGGVLNGSPMGVPAILHGREMVLPLPEQLTESNIRNLALGIQTDPSTALIESIRASLTQGQTSDKQLIDSSDKMAVMIQTMNTKFDDLINSVREVAVNTDRTARGVA